jgi:hypothetical protein
MSTGCHRANGRQQQCEAGIVLSPRGHRGQTAPQIGISGLADAHKTRHASGGMLARYQPKPGCEFPPSPESGSIAHAGDNGGRDLWPHSRNLQQSLAASIIAANGFNLLVEFVDLLFQIIPLLPEEIE